jgi:hypothetical protein
MAVVVQRSRRVLALDFKKNALLPGPEQKMLGYLTSLTYNTRENSRAWGIEWTNTVGNSMLDILFDLAKDCEYLGEFATTKNKKCLHGITVNKLRGVSVTRGQRAIRSRTAMPWHVDRSQTMTFVYVMYVHKDGHIVRGAVRGGAISYSTKVDGTVSKRVNGRARPAGYESYFPQSNSVYCFPGAHVQHSVTSVCDPNVTRYAVVMQWKLKLSIPEVLEGWVHRLQMSKATDKRVLCKVCLVDDGIVLGFRNDVLLQVHTRKYHARKTMSLRSQMYKIK